MEVIVIAGALDDTSQMGGLCDGTKGKRDRKSDRESELWQEYLSAKSIESRNALVEFYQPFLDRTAGVLYYKCKAVIDVDEIKSVLSVAILDVIGRYNPDVGVRFISFAMPRLRGALFDHMRGEDILPRTVRKDINSRAQLRERLEQLWGRSVNDQELDDYAAPQVEEFHVIHLDEQVFESGSGRDTTLHRFLTGRDPLQEKLRRELSEEFFGYLERRFGKKVGVILREVYIHDRTLAYVAKLLKISESRVCQLHSQAINQLRQDPEWLYAKMEVVGLRL